MDYRKYSSRRANISTGDIFRSNKKKGSRIGRLSPEDYAALAEFRYAMRKFLRFSKCLLAEKAKLTPEQYEALLALKVLGTEEGETVGLLSERLQVVHHTAVSLTNKLLEAGLITKESGLTDRREVRMKLTKAGESVLAPMAAMHREKMRVLSPEMIKALTHLRH
jgi:DNA-binding MarR family transcriptional regulator